MPSPHRFWDRIAQRYAKSPIADEAAYQKKLEVTREYLQPHMDVLEIGCGTGSAAILHAPFVKHIRATDFSQAMLDIAGEKARAAGVDNISFECCAAEAVVAADGSVDVILALSVLHLLEDKQAVIAALYRMLRPGGVLVTSTVCIKDSVKWFPYVAPIGRLLGIFPVVKAFTLTDLRDSLTHAGFTVDYEWCPGKRKAVFIVAKKSV